jgi:hypothetical protein
MKIIKIIRLGAHNEKMLRILQSFTKKYKPATTIPPNPKDNYKAIEYFCLL